MMTGTELYKEWEQRTLAQGEARGKAAGKAEGVEQGLAPLLRQFERRLGRALTDAEHGTLRLRLDTLGPARLGDVVLDMDVAALSGWLADPDAK